MAEQSVGGDGTADSPSLAERAQALVASWDELQAEGWNAMAAAAQYEEVERIAALAEEAGAREFAGPSVEMAVYLCAFVEGRLYPSNAQRAKLNEMVSRLRAAAQGSAPARAGPPKSPPAAQRVVLYLRPADAAVPGLAAQLARHRYAVVACDGVDAAVAEAERSPPEVLLVDAGSLAGLAAVIDAAERARGDAMGRAACLVIGAGIDHTRRLFAQRAGADAVLEVADPDELVTRIDQLLAQQRSLDYRVLIVEDDRGQAQFCASVLQLRGIVTEVCATGEDALAAVASFHPDLVLLDLYLPGINGIEVAQRIRERPEHAFLPIVFLSGETDLEKRFDAIRMGGDDFITKPVKPRHLLTEVETRVRRARQMPARSEPPPRAERRGVLASRPAFMAALERTASDSEPTALVLVSVAGDDALVERLGLLASGTFAQEFGAALAADVDLLRPVCACGELAFLGLMRGDGDAALRVQLDRLHERVAARRWGGEAEPQALPIAVAGLRLVQGGAGGDAAIRRLRQMVHDIGERGGVEWEPGRAGAPGEDPELRLARTLLRSPLLAEAIRIEYQALVPLSGELSGQYRVRFALVAPRASNRMEVAPERLREVARALGMVPAADRQCLRRALAVLAERIRRGDELRLFLPVGVESVLDPAFAPWLAAELTSRAMSPASVTLELSAAELLREGARIGEGLDSLQLVGTRLCIAGLEGGEPHLALLRLPTVSMVQLSAPGAPEAAGAWGAERGRLVVEAGKRGKLTIAMGARDAREIGELLKLGVRYVASDLFAPWSSEANFDFSGIRM